MLTNLMEIHAKNSIIVKDMLIQFVTNAPIKTRKYVKKENVNQVIKMLKKFQTLTEDVRNLTIV